MYIYKHKHKHYIGVHFRNLSIYIHLYVYIFKCVYLLYMYMYVCVCARACVLYIKFPSYKGVLTYVYICLYQFINPYIRSGFFFSLFIHSYFYNYKSVFIWVANLGEDQRCLARSASFWPHQ